MYEVKPEQPNLIKRLLELSFDQGKGNFKEFKVEIAYKNGIGYTDQLPIQGCTTALCNSVSESTLLPENVTEHYFDFTLLNWTDSEKEQVEQDFKEKGLEYFVENNWSVDYDKFFIDVPFIVNLINGDGNIALAPPPDYPDPDLDIKFWEEVNSKNIDEIK
jgi:hypothetical protein